MPSKKWKRSGRDFTSPFVKTTTFIGQENIVIRACLKCGKSFQSLGKSNRLCERCNSINEYAPRQVKIVVSKKPLSGDGDADGV